MGLSPLPRFQTSPGGPQCLEAKLAQDPGRQVLAQGFPSQDSGALYSGPKEKAVGWSGRHRACSWGAIPGKVGRTPLEHRVSGVDASFRRTVPGTR